jgi:hypothetical protein
VLVAALQAQQPAQQFDPAARLAAPAQAAPAAVEGHIGPLRITDLHQGAGQRGVGQVQAQTCGQAGCIGQELGCRALKAPA